MEPLFSQIIINDAFTAPERHLNLSRRSEDEPEIVEGRRVAGYYAGGRTETVAVIDRVWNELTGVTKIRQRVAQWRQDNYPGATAVSRLLLNWWARTDKVEFNLFFCQREAVETIIWLVESAESDRAGLSEIASPDPFIRYCCKMATGSGKTTVMAMLAAWSVINKVNNRRDARFSDAVLVVCPNVTVRERLQVLLPAHPRNEYDYKELLPPGTDFKARLSEGFFQIINWQQLSEQNDGDRRSVVQRAAITHCDEQLDDESFEKSK